MSKWLTLIQAAAYIGPRRGDRPTSRETVRLWHTRGLYGIRLEAQYRGAFLFTTEQWIDEFFAKVGDVKERNRCRAAAFGMSTPTQKRKRVEKAKAELERMGAL